MSRFPKKLNFNFLRNSGEDASPHHVAPVPLHTQK